LILLARKLFCALALLCMVAGTAAADTSIRYVFNVSYGGVKIGEMTVSGAETATAYAAVGHLDTTGLVGAFFDFEYDYATQGYIRNGQYLPVEYRSKTREGKRTWTQRITYSGDRIATVAFQPAREINDGVIGARGTIDLMTLIYRLVKPMPKEAPCSFQGKLHNGKSLYDVKLAVGTGYTGEKISCVSNYTKNGEPANGLVPAGVVYKLNREGMYEVDWFSLDTNIGTLRVERKR